MNNQIFVLQMIIIERKVTCVCSMFSVKEEENFLLHHNKFWN